MSKQDYEAILRMLDEIAEEDKNTEITEIIDDIETDDDVEVPAELRAGDFDLLID